VSARAALAVLGDPLKFTLSPVLHRAGLAALGLPGDSQALRTSPEDLGERLAALAARGLRGVNLTAPLKEAALSHVQRVSEDARRARSVNTIGFEAGGWWGDTTDGPGLIDLLGSLGRDLTRTRVVLLGAGGAARSLGLALCAAGVETVAASSRRPDDVYAAWGEMPEVELVEWRSAEEAARLARATLVINATPLADPTPLERIDRSALLIDLVYGPEITPWVLAARALGREAYDGLGLLVFQARRSLALWYARPVPLEPLARAVGWPR
jgi:shikimate dehydrogenase